MSDRDDTLYIIRMNVDTAALFRLERAVKAPPKIDDAGYLVHAALRRDLGEAAPQPFAIDADAGRQITVLGYGAHDARALRGKLRERGEAGRPAVADDGSFSAKPMPRRFEPGTQLGYAVRACPVIRRSSGDRRARKGAEVDAFLAECWRVGPDTKVDREAVYRAWLAKQLERRGAATVVTADLVKFSRRRLLRRTQGDQRRARPVERPDAHLQGVLRVDDAAAFQALLRRGVGRHRAFGFGMLLLSRA